MPISFTHLGALDKQHGYGNHSGKAALYKKIGDRLASLLDNLRLRYTQRVHNVIDFFFHGKTFLV